MSFIKIWESGFLDFTSWQSKQSKIITNKVWFQKPQAKNQGTRNVPWKFHIFNFHVFDSSVFQKLQYFKSMPLKSSYIEYVTRTLIFPAFIFSNLLQVRWLPNYYSYWNVLKQLFFSTFTKLILNVYRYYQ